MYLLFFVTSIFFLFSFSAFIDSFLKNTSQPQLSLNTAQLFLKIFSSKNKASKYFV